MDVPSPAVTDRVFGGIDANRFPDAGRLGADGESFFARHVHRQTLDHSPLGAPDGN